MRLSELTALYSPLDVAYNQAMSGPYQDISYHGKDCTVIAGLKDGRIDGFWRPVVASGDAKALKLHIERLYDISRDIVYMDFLEGGRLSVISQFLLRRGYRARPYYTQIIDLTKTESQLHADLRKSYKSLVAKVGGSVIYIGGSIERFRNIHKKHHGNTRSDETWAIQEKMNCLYVIKGDSGAMFYRNGDSAYYASGTGNNNHVCVWLGIRALEERDCKMLEMGEQVFSGDTKLVNISKFKRGFGGQTVTRLILEKESK